jgi:predicted regulator of Ras-like GTPase activity (Roadblock/LC7/MglB family)
MTDLRTVLAELARVDGVAAALVVGRDGFLIGGVSAEEDLDLEDVGAVTASAVGASEILSADLRRGQLVSVMLEYEGGVVVVAPAGPEAMLVVVTTGSATLGRVRLEVRKRRAAVVEAL